MITSLLDSLRSLLGVAPSPELEYIAAFCFSMFGLYLAFQFLMAIFGWIRG